MNKYLQFLLEVILIVSVVIVFYVSTIDHIIFNRDFLQVDNFTWLFYLLPIILSFIFLVAASLTIEKIRLLSLVFIVLSNSYLALSIFMVTGIYCEEEKNLNMLHIFFVLLIAFLFLPIYFKKLLPKFSTFDTVLISGTTIFSIAELYFNLFSYDLIYQNLIALSY